MMTHYNGASHLAEGTKKVQHCRYGAYSQSAKAPKYGVIGIFSKLAQISLLLFRSKKFIQGESVLSEQLKKLFRPHASSGSVVWLFLKKYQLNAN
ncbi:MAG: hypothetical protein ACOH2G_17555 [Ewingella sp.]